MRRMFDSINVMSLPVGGDLYGGYDDGNWPDAAAIAARFPGKTVVKFTVNSADNEGDCLDVEQGDASPIDAPGWVYRRRIAGHGGPLVYCSEAAWAEVRGQFRTQNVPEPGYFIAGYPGNVGANLYPGSVGHQWVDHGPYDESVVADYLPGIDPPQVVKPAPPPTFGTPFGEDTMQAVPFSLTTNAAGKMDIGIPLPPGCTKVIAASLDLKAAEAAPAGVWDALAFAAPAVGGTNAGEIVAYGAPNHFYTGTAICA